MSNDDSTNNLPNRPDFLEWIEDHFNLPFRIPRIPFHQAARNLDKAVSNVLLAGGDNVAARIRASTARRQAQSTAETKFIELGQSQLEKASPELAERALQHALGDAVQKQRNREEILQIAAEHISSDPPQTDAPEEIETDWLNAFSRFAEIKSDADIQHLWARILAAEIRGPGTTSLRTLDLLSKLSSADANFIIQKFRYVIDGKFIPNWVHSQNVVTYPELVTLKDLDIISEVPGIAGSEITKGSIRKTLYGQEVHAAFFSYFNRAYIFTNATTAFEIKFQVCVLTKVGRQLFGLTQLLSPDYQQIDKFAASLKSEGVQSVRWARITQRMGEEVILGPPTNIA